jgi:hypothetical protein
MATSGLGSSCVRGTLGVPVPWKRADALQERLRGRGIAATLCLDPATRTAILEVHSEAEAETLRQLLDPGQD